MPLSRTIRDICVPKAEYPQLPDTASLRDAFVVLRKGYVTGRRYRHLLILNERHELVGVLGIRDILRGLMPDYLRTEELGRYQAPVPDFPALTLIWAETCRTQCKEAAKKSVRGFMGPVPATLHMDDPITKAAYLMVIHDTNILPVIEGERLVGVARAIDVFNEAGRMVLDD
jgi:CBS domain-containing protein